MSEIVRVLSHHVGQVPLADIEFLHLLLDKLHRELFGASSCQVLPVHDGTCTYLFPDSLEEEKTARTNEGLVLQCSHRITELGGKTVETQCSNRNIELEKMSTLLKTK